MIENYLNEHSTERLKIRPLRMEDAEIWATFLLDERATQYFPEYMRPSFPGISREQAETWVARQIQRYEAKKFGLLALEEQSSGKFIGMCGLLTQLVDDIPELEIGYHLLPKYHGKGYATEAAQYFKSYAFSHFPIPIQWSYTGKRTSEPDQYYDSIISIIDLHNIPSQKVAKRNGMTVDKQTFWKELEVLIYRVYPETD